MSLIVESSTENDVRDRVTHVAAEFLRLTPAEIDPGTPLVLYGLDSLRSVEIVAALEQAFGRTLPEWLLVDHPDVDALSRALGANDIRIADDETSVMVADSLLPADIRPPAAQTGVDPGRCILLTGATGFLGAYLLRELLAETEADIYCLVRAGRCEGLTRIRRNLERYDLWNASLASRIHAVSGDLSQPNLGLAAGEYAVVCERVDTIYHAAADVNWVVPYVALREVNVFGTRELIRLACRQRPKTFHFISTLSVCYAVNGPAIVCEDDDMLPIVDRLPLGYAQSKCVAESLVRQAGARGLTVRIHRPALIAGNSITGISNLDDLIAALLKGCIQMGAAPDLDWTLDAPPVDHVARAIVHLPGQSESRLWSSHLSNRHPRHWRECVLWMNLFGYPVALVPYDAWLDRLARDAQSPDHALHRLRGFFLRRQPDGTTIPELYQDGRRSATDCARTQKAEAALGLDCPRLDAELLDRYFSSYVARGFLPPPMRRGWSPTPEQRTPACYEQSGFLEHLLRQHFADDSLRVCDRALLSSGSEHSIIGELTSWRHRRRTGLFHYRLTLERRNVRQTLDTMVKAKPGDRDVIEVAETVAAICDVQLARSLHEFRDWVGLRGGHLRELAIYEQADPRLRRYMPVCFGTWRDDERGEWGLALEHLEGLALMDATEDPSAWSRAHVDAVIAGLAQIHAVWYDREADLKNQPWIGHTSSLESVVEMTPLWRALASHAAPYLADWTDPAIVRTHQALVDSIGEWWRPLESSPRTLLHNDFSPRNLALRHDEEGFRLCAYDWELATLGAPQRDLAEFLCFVLAGDVSEEEVNRCVELHRATLAAATGRSINADEWRAGFRSALADLLVNRLMFYVMIHRVRQQRFLPRVVRTWRRLNEIFAEGNCLAGWSDLAH